MAVLQAAAAEVEKTTGGSEFDYLINNAAWLREERAGSTLRTWYVVQSTFARRGVLIISYLPTRQPG